MVNPLMNTTAGIAFLAMSAGVIWAAATSGAKSKAATDEVTAWRAAITTSADRRLREGSADF